MKKLIGQIHLWLGLASGFVVFIVSITGCLYVFQEEIKQVIYNDRLNVQVPPDTEPLLLNQTLIAAQNVLNANLKVQRLHIENSPNRSLEFRHRSSNPNPGGIWYWDQVKNDIQVFVDPYTGKVLEVVDHRFEFFNLVLIAHVSLMLRYDIGTPIVGWATLIFVVMLITGFVLWWPKTKKALRNGIWFRWKSNTKWKRKNYDLHNILGFYCMFFALMIALTGLVWAFGWFNKSVQWMANGGEIIKTERKIYKSEIPDLNSDLAIDKAYKELRRRHPNARAYQIYMPRDSSSSLMTRVIGRKRSPALAYYYFDQYGGQLLGDSFWKNDSVGEKVRSYNYDIHTGKIGGIVGKTIAFFISLFSASLPITGFLIWYNRKFKKRRKKAPKMNTSKLNVIRNNDIQQSEENGIIPLKPRK